MRLAQGLYSVLLLTKGAGEPGYITLGLYSAVVLTRGDWEQAALTCTPHRCSLGEPGNEASPGIVLRTGAHQENLGKRLPLGVYSVLVLTRRARERS